MSGVAASRLCSGQMGAWAPIRAALPLGVSKKAGAAASCKFFPEPACIIPASSSKEFVENMPAISESNKWFCARLTISKPINFKSSATS